MAATLLQLVQQAMGELGLPTPTVVASSSDTQVKQFLRLLNAAGYEISRQYDWEALNVQYVFTTTSTTTTGNVVSGVSLIGSIPSTAGLDVTYQVSGTGINQGTLLTAVAPTVVAISQPATASATGATYIFGKVKYAMPADYDRMVDRTQWDKSNHWEALGPCTAQEWEWLQSGFISTGPRVRFRMLGGYFQIWPMITTGATLGFEYVSSYWAANSAGTRQASFVTDTDFCIFPDRLMVLALKCKYWSIKGFDTTKLDRDYEMELSISKANDGGSKTLSMSPELPNILIGWDNLPDSNYGP